jgi:hypothetical protein
LHNSHWQSPPFGVSVACDIASLIAIKVHALRGTHWAPHLSLPGFKSLADFTSAQTFLMSATGSCIGPRNSTCDCLDYEEDVLASPPRCRECRHGRSLHRRLASDGTNASASASAKNKQTVEDLSALLVGSGQYEAARNETVDTFKKRDVCLIFCDHYKPSLY